MIQYVIFTNAVLKVGEIMYGRREVYTNNAVIMQVLEIGGDSTRNSMYLTQTRLERTIHPCVTDCVNYFKLYFRIY